MYDDDDEPTLTLPNTLVRKLRAAAARNVHFEPVAMANEPAEDLDAPTLKIAPLDMARLRRASAG